MTPIERQILKNQKDIMFWISKGDVSRGYFSKRLEETEELLNPTSDSEDCCDMGKFKENVINSQDTKE